MAEHLGKGIISVKADISECVNFFENLKVSEKTINKAILRSVGMGAKKAVKKNYAAVLGKRTGNLYRSIFYKVAKGGGEVYISNDADSGKRTSKRGQLARYGFMLAAGYNIRPKKPGGWLWFENNGRWYKRKFVHVSAIDWVEKPVDRYVNSGTCDADIDKAFQKQVTKVEKKLGVYNGQ